MKITNQHGDLLLEKVSDIPEGSKKVDAQDGYIIERGEGVDVQREIIRKVGAERMLKATKAKTLDVFVDTHTRGGNEYKLMEMSVGANVRRKYLYFEHASLPGVFYAHPVEPSLKRAIHARAWILSLGDVGHLENMSDQEIRDALPQEVS